MSRLQSFRRSIGGYTGVLSPTEALIYSILLSGHRDGDTLLEEVSELIGLQVYTNNGVFLGNINNLVVDVDNGLVEGVFVGETNPLLVEGSKAVSVPYRWVQSVGDIVILRYFPKRVSLKKSPSSARTSESKK
jgi:sporulation protein YlmC with PRC-barrel domain